MLTVRPLEVSHGNADTLYFCVLVAAVLHVR